MEKVCHDKTEGRDCVEEKGDGENGGRRGREMRMEGDWQWTGKCGKKQTVRSLNCPTKFEY